IAEQNAVTPLAPAPDPATQLVQLRQTESFRVLDQHDGRIRDIDPDLDHRRRDEYVDLAIAERAHRGVALVRAQAPVEERERTMLEHARCESLILLCRGLERVLVA